MVNFHHIGDVERSLLCTACLSHHFIVDVAGRRHQSDVPSFLRKHERGVPYLTTGQQEEELGTDGV